ncbi:hypothetical protein AUP68_09581 [Ilyonectria robusta]
MYATSEAPLPPPKSHTRHAQGHGRRQKTYIESSGDQDEDWSDSPSEIPTPSRSHQMPNTQSSYQAHPIDPGNAGYMGQAGGETIPYQHGYYDSNHFAPTHRPDVPPAWTQNTFTPFPMNQTASFAYPTGLNGYSPGPYPNNDPFANPNNANYPPLAPPYHYATNTQPPTHHLAAGNYYQADGFHLGPQPTPQYPTGSGTRCPPPVVNPSYQEYEPERTRGASGSHKTDRRHGKKKPTPVRRERETGDHRETRQEVRKLQKRLDNVESELSERKDVGIRSDPRRSRLENISQSSPVLGRRIPDDLRSWDERRGGESDRLLKDIYLLIKERINQEDRESYGSSRREILEAQNRDRLEQEPGALMELRDNRDIRSHIETVLLDILRGSTLDEPEDNQSQPRPVSSRYAIREGQRRSRVLPSIASRDPPVEPVAPTSGHGRPLRHSRHQNMPREPSGPTTQELEDDPIYGNQTTSTLPQARLQRNSTRRADPKENVEPSDQVNPEPDDPRVPPPRVKRGQESRVSETRDNVGRRREQPAVYRERDDFEKTQGRPVATGRQRRNRNFHAIVPDEDDPESDEPEEPFPTRPPAPYEVRQGHPNLKETFPPAAAPDPPQASRRQSQKRL